MRFEKIFNGSSKNFDIVIDLIWWTFISLGYNQNICYSKKTQFLKFWKIPSKGVNGLVLY